jgi:murein DD-endopeptidase MepM/ murein hydrolase activator NlpD
MHDVRLRGRGWSLAIPAADAYDGRPGIPYALALVIASTWFVCAPMRADALGRASDRPPSDRVVERTVQRGERLGAILAGHGMSAAEISRWVRAARPQADLGHLDPGHSLELRFDQSGALRALCYEVDGEHTVTVERDTSDRLTAHSTPLPVTVRAVAVRATVRQSFVAAARQAAVPDRVISQMIDLLGWRVSFKSDVRRGDRLRVLYEQRTARSGRALYPGRILAVDYRGRTQSAAAYLYDERDGVSRYVDDSGHLVNGAPLRYPLEFTRITSVFSDGRFHPILQETRPHLGVDFAAPAGTPVRSIGPGTIQCAGDKAAFGNHVEIDHGGGFVSTYSHLRHIAPGIQPGAQVTPGQLIGWVGQTGLATGTHLHFAIFRDGEYVDPLTVKLPRQFTLIDPATFAHLRDDMQARFQALLDAPAPSAPETGLPLRAQAGGVGPINLTF